MDLVIGHLFIVRYILKLMKPRVRHLIKFAGYSMAIVLPKAFLKKLGWEQGKLVKVHLRARSKTLLIEAQTALSTTAPREESDSEIPYELTDELSPTTNSASSPKDDARPIPEIE